MNTEVFERLSELHEKYGPQEFGKLCQKFLAIGFRMAGYTHVVERGVQGVDVDVAAEKQPKYSIEVKTTVAGSINFERKDVEGLHKRKTDGYQPTLAVLRISRFSDWIFAKADTVKVGSVFIDSLRPYRLRQLEKEICPLIDRAIIEHFEGTMVGGQTHLDNTLREKGIDTRPS